jgi:predicted permease
VAIISDDLWRSRFASDPQIIGKRIRVTGSEYEVIGVLPSNFALPALWEGLNQSKPKMWVPLPADLPANTEIGLAVIGRLKTSATLDDARSEMKVIAKRLQRAYPDKNRGWGINVFPTLNEDVSPTVRRSLYVLQVAVGFVLLIACANVANLLLTKAVAREQEIAIRIALGAGRWQIVRQTMSEGLLLSFFGGTLGLLLSIGALRLISVLAPRDTHGFHELRIDPLVLAFTFGSVVVSAILFGLAPSLYSMTRGVSQALSRQSRSVSGSANAFRTLLVLAEISLSLILLIGATLTIQSLRSLMTLDLGFDPQHLLTMNIALPTSRYTNPQQVANFNDRLFERVQQLPQVSAASLSSALPMRSISEQSYQLPGVPIDPTKPKVTDWTRMTEQHVRAVGMRVLRGRDLQRADVMDASPHVALVNEAFARANWPNQDALGKTLLFAGESSSTLVPYNISVSSATSANSDPTLRRIRKSIFPAITCRACH